MRLTFLTFLLPASVFAQSSVSYEKDVAPILRSYCAGCHNDKELKGELSVETLAKFRKGGEDHGDPIKPGDASASFFIRCMEGQSKPKMPPKDEPQVPAADLETLKQWIASGAPGPEHDESILRTMIVPKLPPSTSAKPVTAAAYSSNGKILALARTGSVELRDVATDASKLMIKDLPGKINAVHFTKDGKQFVIASGITGLMGVAQLRDAETGALIREFGGHSDVLYDAQISPDGKTLATAGYDRTIKLWQLADAKLLRTIDIHKGAIFALAWHPSGKVLASASADETVKLWRVADGVRLDTLNQAQGELCTVLFTPDGGSILAAGKDRRIRLWRFVSKDSPALNPVIISRFAHESQICGLALSADGKTLLSSAEDRSLKLWSLPDLTLQHNYEAQSDLCPVLIGTPKSGQFFAARMDGSTAVIAPSLDQPKKKENTEATSALAANKMDELKPVNEVEPNDTPATAMKVALPTVIKGAVTRTGDADVFRFHARLGEALTLEVKAARDKSKLDSRLEILHADGSPVEQAVLQATRDTWFTFRGKDSDVSDDFRLQNWAEMELNEYLYANGEVVKLWLYPRGPDSGFKVYPGSGKRHTFFGTPAIVHAMGEFAYIVKPLPAGSQPAPNGLPVFHVNYENDDDSSRRFGADSLLLFTAPKEADYLVRLTDVRGFGAAKEFGYSLTIRPQQPDFKVTHTAGSPKPAAKAGAKPVAKAAPMKTPKKELKVSPGSGREIVFNAERMEGFDGPIKIDIQNLPTGFTASTPVQIEAGQATALVVLSAAADAKVPGAAASKAIKIVATAQVAGKEVTRELGGWGELGLAPTAKVAVEILPGDDRSYVKETPGAPLEFNIHPGQTISAKVRAIRRDFTGRIELGKEDAGRNLPHGLYVDNVGLSGLLIVEGQTEREFFITASPVAQPTTRYFHLKANADEGQTSQPVIIHVLPTAAPTTASVK